MLVCLAALLGCGTVRIPFSGVVPGPTFQGLTGNWEIAVTSTNGPAPFTLLAGFIDEPTQPSSATAATQVTASLQLANPSPCFVGALLVPSVGQIQAGTLGLSSFTINGQFLQTTSTVAPTGATLTGTYLIQNGCAGDLHEQGTLAGTRFATVKGLYQGPLTGAASGVSLGLALTQNTVGNGDGSFFVSGTATITGSSCFTQGALQSASGSVLGSTIQMVFNDPASGAQVAVTGTFDPAARTITVKSVDVTGGSCAGHLGSASLTLQA